MKRASLERPREVGSSEATHFFSRCERSNEAPSEPQLEHRHPSRVAQLFAQADRRGRHCGKIGAFETRSSLAEAGRQIESMQQMDRPKVWFPIASLLWLIALPLFGLLFPEKGGLTITASFYLWAATVPVIWFLVLAGAMSNYRAYSHLAAAQTRLWVWIAATAAPIFLLFAGMLLSEHK